MSLQNFLSKSNEIEAYKSLDIPSALDNYVLMTYFFLVFFFQNFGEIQVTTISLVFCYEYSKAGDPLF